MSAPRLIVPGTTYLLGRRCFGRQLLLRPSAKINQIFEFCLAVAAARTGVLVHAHNVLSNHYHLVATDVRGNLPVFMHWLNEYVAKCVNAELGRWESFWTPGSYSAVRLVDREAVLDKLAYVYTNPVEAGLVPRHEEWPGARSLPADLEGGAKWVDRPEGFFRENGSVPARARLGFVLPRAFEGDVAASMAALRALVREREIAIRAKRRRMGAGFLGRRRVLEQSPLSRPRRRATRRGLNPRLASRDKWRRIEALQRLKSFLVSYREAWRRFCDGERQVVFPYGTYAMRVRFGVRCAGP